MYFYAFYPIGLDLTLKRRPWLSWTIIASMVVTFLWQQYAPYRLPVLPQELVFWPGNGAPLTVKTPFSNRTATGTGASTPPAWLGGRRSRA